MSASWVTVIGVAAWVFVFGLVIGGAIEEMRWKKQSACQHAKLRTTCVDCHKEITDE